MQFFFSLFFNVYARKKKVFEEILQNYHSLALIGKLKHSKIIR